MTEMRERRKSDEKRMQKRRMLEDRVVDLILVWKKVFPSKDVGEREVEKYIHVILSRRGCLSDKRGRERDNRERERGQTWDGISVEITTKNISSSFLSSLSLSLRQFLSNNFSHPFLILLLHLKKSCVHV